METIILGGIFLAFVAIGVLAIWLTPRCKNCGSDDVFALKNEEQTVFVGMACRVCGAFKPWSEKDWYSSWRDYPTYKCTPREHVARLKF